KRPPQSPGGLRGSSEYRCGTRTRGWPLRVAPSGGVPHPICAEGGGESASFPAGTGEATVRWSFHGGYRWRLSTRLLHELPHAECGDTPHKSPVHPAGWHLNLTAC